MLNGFKTYLGIALAVIGGLANELGVPAATDLPEWAATATTVVGGVLAFVGRWDRERRGN